MTVQSTTQFTTYRNQGGRVDDGLKPGRKSLSQVRRSCRLARKSDGMRYKGQAGKGDLFLASCVAPSHWTWSELNDLEWYLVVSPPCSFLIGVEAALAWMISRLT